MAGIMAGEGRITAKPVLQDQTSVPEKEVTQPRKKKVDALKSKVSAHRQPTKQKDEAQYFFHPRVDLSQVAPGEGMSRVSVPLEGQLVPMAIPLGKPRTNPALRPPIATQDEKHTSQVEGNVLVLYESLCSFSLVLKTYVPYCTVTWQRHLRFSQNPP